MKSRSRDGLAAKGLFGLSKSTENISYELTFKPRRNFEFKLNNACMHNTINEFGFCELSFQARAFI